ncbi:LysR family transcriptional regulator [Pseudarthrobacter sp. J1738]|uniref:LysR family transcriptional regulator n=1 Tax=unclassified Pseudarthrobacter TaxID=2647000 RepID=UPI003D2E9010
MLGPQVPSLAALETLVTVGELGSLSRVAELFGVSQQAVSSQVRSMEKVVGAELIVRSPRGSELTTSGAMVAAWAQEVLSAAARLEAGIDSIKHRAVQRLDVAASLTIAEYLLPRWLVALREWQEELAGEVTQVGLKAVNSEAVISLVRGGEVRLGFLETPDLPTDLHTEVLGHDSLVIAVAPRHPWAMRRTPVTVAELAQTGLITREEGSGTRKVLEQMFVKAGFLAEAVVPPRQVHASTAAVRTAIAAGVAPGVLSSLAVEDDLTLGRLVVVEVAGVDLRRQLTAVWRGGARPVEAPVRDLMRLARRSLVGSAGGAAD